MKNEGFTLVELLAVILILSFIAIIAVPIVLNIITEAKIKSLKISTSEYIRAVNTSLINEEVFNNVSDGLYTITDDGKKIVLGDKEIFINYDGRGLKSGLLLIENSKVTRVLKGLIDDYYARVADEDIEILKNLNESTLVSGQDFNKKVKELVRDTKDDGSTPDYNTVDTKVKKIIFLQDSVLPEGITKEELEEFKYTDLSSKSDGSIKGYYDEVNQAIYVYSEGYISCPAYINSMFQNFQGAEEIELNLMDTSKSINMGAMFSTCKSLKNINLFGLDTSQVTIMNYMFDGCNTLKIINLSSFNTSRVLDMSYMFRFCNNLLNIKGLENFDTSQVTTMRAMFEKCFCLADLNLTSFNTSKVGSMIWMFESCTGLSTVTFGKNFNTSRVTSMDSMFSGCSNLEEINGLEYFDTSQVLYMNSMFSGCSSLKKLKLNSFNTVQVINMVLMFSGCSSLEYLDLSNFNTKNVNSGSNIFQNCTKLKSIKFGENSTFEKVTDMIRMFAGCSSLIELDLSNFNTSSVTNMGGMFDGCNSLISVNLSNFDTSKVTWLRCMFQNCSSLEELDLTSFDTHSATDYGMFPGCKNLKVVKVTKDKWTLDTSLLNGTQTQNYTYVN